MLTFSGAAGAKANSLQKYIADVQEGRFPELSHLVKMEAPFLDEVARLVGCAPTKNQD